MTTDMGVSLLSGGEDSYRSVRGQAIWLDQLSDAMRCVDLAVLVGYRSDRLGIDVPSERVAAMVDAEPTRRIGFAGIDVTAPSVASDLRAVKDLGLSGVSIAPADQACRATDDRFKMALEWCAREGLPVLLANPGLHQRESVLEYARPSDFDEPLREIEGLRMVLGDVGRAFAGEALVLAAKHEHVFVELSTVAKHPWSLRRLLLEAKDLGVLDKLMFGSGYPRELPEHAIAKMYHVNGPSLQASGDHLIPREQLRLIIERDSASLLGIDHDATPRATGAEPARQGDALEVVSTP